MDVLKATELYTLKQLILWSVNFSSIFFNGDGEDSSHSASLKLGRNPDLPSLSISIYDHLLKCPWRFTDLFTFLPSKHSFCAQESGLPLLASLTKPTTQKLPNHKVLGGFKELGLWSLTPPSPSLPPANGELVSSGLGHNLFPHFLPSTNVQLFSGLKSLATTALIKSSFTFCKFWESLQRYRPHNNLPRNVSGRESSHLKDSSGGFC